MDNNTLISICKTFINSATYVFQKELLISQIKKRDIIIKSQIRPSFPLSILIKFSGAEMKGQVIYSAGNEFVEQVLKVMMPYKLPVDRRKYSISAVSELANMISGRATISLAGNNTIVDITPPIVVLANAITEEDRKKCAFLKAPAVVVNLDSNIGTIEVSISFLEKIKAQDISAPVTTSQY